MCACVCVCMCVYVSSGQNKTEVANLNFAL